MSQLVLAVSAAIVMSALCSLFEAVLYSVPMSHIETMAQKGRSAGRILKQLRDNVDRPISAILSLNTVANTAGAAVAGAAAGALLGERWLVFFSAAFTLAILLFSEVIPKTAGVVYGRALAPFIARPLLLLVWVFTPLVWLCQVVTRLIFRNRAEPEVSDEELVVMARLGLQSGAMRTDEVQVIENILALETKKARDVMTPRSVMVSLSQNASVEEARNEPGVLTHGRIPIYGKTPDDVVGIAHRRDILTSQADGKGEGKVSEIMRPAHFVPTSAPLHRVLRRFIERRQHMFVVADEHGGVAGIITLEDIMEEILGKEIMDEFDEVADMREIARSRRDDLLNDQES